MYALYVPVMVRMNNQWESGWMMVYLSPTYDDTMTMAFFNFDCAYAIGFPNGKQSLVTPQ